MNKSQDSEMIVAGCFDLLRGQRAAYIGIELRSLLFLLEQGRLNTPEQREKLKRWIVDSLPTIRKK